MSRLYRKLSNQLWMLTVSYLPIKFIVLTLPTCCRYFNHDIVWGQYSGRLMWREMAQKGPDVAQRGQGHGVNAYVFKLFDHSEALSATALMRACQYNAPSTHVITLLKGGSDEGVNLRSATRYGEYTALQLCENDNATDTFQALLSAKADPNVASDDGWTQLMKACCWGSKNMVRLLLEAHADVTIEDEDGETALDCARQRYDQHIVDMLLDAMELAKGSVL